MGSLVLDASAALRVVLDSKHEADTIEALRRADVVYAPALFAAETANALWKYVGARHLDEAGAQRLHADAMMLVDRFIADVELFPEALTVASRAKHPVYDALYVVAARRTGSALLTNDKRLAALASALDVDVA